MSKLSESLSLVKKVLSEVRMYNQASAVLNFDMQTICPKEGMNAQGEVDAFLSNKAFVLQKDAAYIEACLYIYDHRDELMTNLTAAWPKVFIVIMPAKKT